MTVRRERLRLANLLLVLVILALGWTIHQQLDAAVPGVPLAPTAVAAPLRQTAAAAPLNASDAVFRPALLQSYDEIIARPLFQRGRRPLPPEAGPAPRQAEEQPLRLFLTGIVEDAGGKWAFVKVGQDPTMKRVGRNGSIAGWTVEAIGRDSITLIKEGKTARLTMRDSRRENEGLSAGERKPLDPPTAPALGLGREQDDDRD